jgi:hypothetical protein
MREEVLLALENIYNLYTSVHGKPVKFIAEMLMPEEEQIITDGGFELNPNAGHICLYVDDGTLYIHEDYFTFFYNGGGRVDFENYPTITEEWHFQVSTSNFVAGQFEHADFPVIREYFDKILAPVVHE